MDPLGFMAVLVMILTIMEIALANRLHNHSIDFTKEKCDHEQTKKRLANLADCVSNLEVKDTDNRLIMLTEWFQALICQLEHEAQISSKARHSVNDLTDMLVAVEETGKKTGAEAERHIKDLADRLDHLEE